MREKESCREFLCHYRFESTPKPFIDDMLGELLLSSAAPLVGYTIKDTYELGKKLEAHEKIVLSKEKLDSLRHFIETHEGLTISAKQQMLSILD